MQWAKNQKGFTIVELLIVVVVIAILAAITIVAYNGIQNRAKVSAVQSAASQASKKAVVYATLNTDQYPVDLATAGVVASGGTTYQYSFNNSANPRTHCVTATNGSISYFQSNTVTSPALGACAGHGSGGTATITNLIQNPSVEANLTSISNAGSGVTLTRDTTQSVMGSASVRVVADGSATGSGTQQLAATTAYPAGVYRGSLYVKGTAGVQLYAVLRATGSGVADLSSSNITMTGAWQRIELSPMTITSSTTTQFSLMARTSSAIATTFWVDGGMLFDGSASSAFADGNTSGWAWNGTDNNSTSTGMPQ